MRQLNISPAKIAVFVFLAWAFTGCQLLAVSSQPTPLPTEMLPTIIAKTMEAGRTVIAAQVKPTSTLATATSLPATLPTETVSKALKSPTFTAEVIYTPTPVPAEPGDQPPPSPEIPLADIQVRGIGQLSRMASPITVNAYLKPGANGRIQVDLLGEDWRVIARVIKVVSYVDQYGKAMIYFPLPFEIPGTAEAGLLRISTTDTVGRITALTTIPLILISIGETDIFPAADNLATIAVLVPAPKTLIQGKTMVVYGWARTSSDRYLMVQLVTDDGRVVGKRVTKVDKATLDGYGNFTVEVPFEVNGPSPALLMVWEGGDNLSNIINLTSVEVMLSP
jgi:hypothetical protein